MNLPRVTVVPSTATEAPRVRVALPSSLFSRVAAVDLTPAQAHALSNILLLAVASAAKAD